jgi:hypothetical protein
MTLGFAGFPPWSVDQYYGVVMQNFADKIVFVVRVHNKSKLAAHRFRPIRPEASVI